jgi:2-hydroxychromene-2-carboxylate isomerase
LIAALLQGAEVDGLAHCLLQAHWRDDADLADEETLARLGEEAGVRPTVDPGPVVATTRRKSIGRCAIRRPAVRAISIKRAEPI